MLEDFNVSVENRMKCFCDNYDLKNLIKQPACHKFYAYKIATQFLQYTSVRNGFAWLSFDDFSCYEKIL